MSLIYASFSPTKFHPGCTGNLYPKLPKMCQFLGSFLVDTIAAIEYMCLSRNYFDINWKRKPEPTICNFVTVYKLAFWTYPLPKSKFLSLHLLSLTSPIKTGYIFPDGNAMSAGKASAIWRLWTRCCPTPSWHDEQTGFPGLRYQYLCYPLNNGQLY